MKLCKDCKWIESKEQQFPYCLNPETAEVSRGNHIDYVHGTKSAPAYRFCNYARLSEFICGPDAKHFEERIEDAPKQVEYESLSVSIYKFFKSLIDKIRK